MAGAALDPWGSSENLRAMMLNYSLAADSGELVERPGVSLVNSGIAFSAFNAALLTGASLEHPRELRACLQHAQRYFHAKRLPWSFWMAEERVSPQVRQSASIAVNAAGLRWIAQHEGMMADRLSAPVRALPAIEVRRVFDRATRGHFARLSSTVFNLPQPVSSSVYGQPDFWSGTLAGWVGYWEGHPVCCAATQSAAGVIGLYSVATHPGFRGRGFAESITRHALEKARQASGLHVSILHATREGQPLYRQLGFRYATRLDVYVTA
ncbi:MAG: GNAT family N-acetyltransferase [Bryobacterales bacterium]|nr:GNAT family N-acetyltransferase [Bryobacterales bacterium]